MDQLSADLFVQHKLLGMFKSNMSDNNVSDIAEEIMEQGLKYRCNPGSRRYAKRFKLRLSSGLDVEKILIM